MKALILPAFAALVIAYDAWLKATGRKTISTEVQAQARRRPIVPFAYGVLFGGLAVHFFPF